VFFTAVIRRVVFCLILFGGMIAPVLGQDLVVDSGTTNITSSTNYANTYIGSNSTASNNLLNVYGSGVVLSNSTNVYVGYAGSSNSLVISNEARVVSSSGYIGYTNNSSNNSVLVTGTNSAWTNSLALVIGLSGSSNSLVISNGAGVVNQFGRIGFYEGSSNNIVTVTGTNSAWTNTVDLFVGKDGSSNSLVVSSGGSVVNQGSGTIGANFSNNSVLVTGTASTWTNAGDLFVGNFGSSNSLVISDEASVVNANGFIGSQVGSSNNIVTVTGTNSAWTNAGNLSVGYFGSSNSLVISIGAV